MYPGPQGGRGGRRARPMGWGSSFSGARVERAGVAWGMRCRSRGRGGGECEATAPAAGRRTPPEERARAYCEAMVGVGEMIASAMVKQITSRLIKIAGDEISLQWKFKGEVDKMAEKMKYLAAVMHDADNKVRRGGIHGETVGLWLLQLKSISYDIEDLLDDLDSKNNEAKLKIFFSRNNQAYQWITRPHNLEDVGKRIEELKNEGKAFNLDPEARVEQSKKNDTFAAISDGGTKTGMQGRSAEKDKLIRLLLRTEANERISIIPIVGLGGIGKTTLAQSVYADKRVNVFDIQAWVHVSDKFDLRKIVRTIIRSVDININLDTSHKQFLHNILQVTLTGKKYLIVLDDFWEEDGDNLEELKQMLQHGSNGSRIVVTTRKQSVVETMSTGDLAHQRVILPVCESDQINLGVLPTDDCWELMKIRAFGPHDDQTPLKQIGYEIASKCGGIPLVANALGKVMSGNKSVGAWQDIKLRMVDLGLRGEHQKDTLESLKLSYYYMKLEFKICFAYFVAFPKGFIIDTNRLIQQWNALGYIYSEHDGRSCIDYLLGMSFLQISGPPSASQRPMRSSASRKLSMHDLVHDLASIITGDEFVVLDADSTELRTWKKAIHCRHAELIQYKNQSNVFEHLPKKLRSLHIRDSQRWQLPPKAFSQSKYMRVLDLSCSVGQLSEGQSTSSNIRLPCSIKKMKLLRYLDATGLPVPSLSKSVCTLQNMETLIMSNCLLDILPDDICNLHKLCYLDLSGNRSLIKLPASLGKLSKLSFLNLSGCSILQDVPKSICQLTCLQHIDMSECRAIHNLPDKFGSLPNILFLNLSGCSKLTKLPDSVNLEYLEHLDLSSCHELENLPQDFGNLRSLVFLNLSDCYKVSVLPESFCQLIHLKDLDLSDCHNLSELPDCFGNLSELDSLNLTSCSKLQLLPESFCKLFKLRHLNLSYCMRLEKLPPSLDGLKLQLLDLSSVTFHDLPDSLHGITTLTQLVVTSARKKVYDQARDIRKRLNLAGMIVHTVHQIENKGCSSIVELAELACEELQVLRLYNVRYPEDAERAKLRDKTDLRLLNLRWGLQGEEDKSVLERLIPPRTLEHFFLSGYMNKDFPNWMSHISTYLPSLTYLRLSDLGTCDMLPPVGGLPNLRSLVMQNIPNLRKIVTEFYGVGGETCTKLRTIQLESMENLVEWWTTLSGEENEEFLIPNLHSLEIKDCPKLKFLPYPPRSMFWRLNDSNMVLPKEGFGKLSSSALPFEMVVKNCNFAPHKWDRLQHLPTLEIFHVDSCNGLRALPEVFRCLTSLTKLYLWAMKDLDTLPECLGNLTSLEHISMEDCPLVTSLPESMKKLTALRVLWLKECIGLEVLPEWLGELISLEEFSIVCCPNLTYLPETVRNLTALKELYIWGCPSLVERCQGEDATMISHIPEVTLYGSRRSRDTRLPKVQ
uniref:Uncharacterized protein n=3 Tax=Avena sativa TaxID=4498 RepID=A0ACD5WP45_AVESA